MGVVDVTGEKDSGVHLAPVCAHLFTVLTAGIEIGNFISSEDVVHVLGELSLQRTHDGELLADEDLGEQFLCTGEDHRLLAEVLEEGALGEELGHIANLMSRLLR